MAVLYGNVTNHWRSYMDYSESAATQMPNATITVKAGMQSQAWGFSIGSGISCKIECTGQSATSVGGQSFSSATGATTSKQMATRTFTIPRTRATQTVTVKVTVTNSSGYANGTSTVSRTFTISPLASHTVSYNANGGSGAPGNQTKWYGSVLTLSTQVPTRTNHTFQGWATSASGYVAYQPGGRYAADANVTLYAIWKQSVSPPTVTDAHATRCTSGGVDNDEGTYYHVKLTYKADTAVVTANKVTSVKVEHRAVGASAWTAAGTTTVSAASGSYASSACGGGSIGTGSSYEVRVTVTDAQGLSTSVLLGVGPSYYTMDVLANGRGIAFGRNCPAAGLYVNEPTYWWGDGGSGSVQLTGAQMVQRMGVHIRSWSVVVQVVASSGQWLTSSALQLTTASGHLARAWDRGKGDVLYCQNGDTAAQNVGVYRLQPNNDCSQCYLHTTGATAAGSMRLSLVVVQTG